MNSNLSSTGSPCESSGVLSKSSQTVQLSNHSLRQIPMVSSIYQLIVPHFALGLSIGAIDAAMNPMLAYIMDVKYGSDYGLVYAIAQIAVCTAYGVAPLLGAQLADYFGFGSLMRLLGLLNLVQAALIHFSVKQNLLLSDDTPDKDRDDLGKIISKIQSRLGFSKNAEEEYKEIKSSSSS